MHIRPYREGDWDELERLNQALFPDFPQEELAQLRSTIARPDAGFFVAERPGGGLAGYVEAGTRSVADGCESSPVGYIEAWYVDPDVRRHGVGRALLAAAEDWARVQGYREMASDALLDNEVSHRAHVASGYQMLDRVVLFRKDLNQEPT